MGLGRYCFNAYAGYSLGNCGDLVNMCSASLLVSLLDRVRCIACGDEAFNEYSITFDGTPSFAEAEAIVLRFVTKDYNVIELLVKCSLFKKKLNAQELGSHVVDTIVNRLGLPLKD